LEVMSSKRGESAGSACGGAKEIKVGKMKQEGRQSKLVTEDKVGGKRVSFRLDKDKEGEEKLEKIRMELKTELRKRFKELEDRVEKEKGEIRGEVRACKE